jgi:hypothetical protein
MAFDCRIGYRFSMGIRYGRLAVSLHVGLFVAAACSGNTENGQPQGGAGGAGVAGSSSGGGSVVVPLPDGGVVVVPNTGGGAGAGGGGGVLGGGGGAAGAPTCDGGPCNIAPAGLLDPAVTTTWNPGILADDQTKMPLGVDGLPVRTTVCAHPAPGADLNAAIAACPEGQVVQLAAGTYTVSKTVQLTKGVVLRGAGSGGAAKGGTTIVKTGGGTVVQIGTDKDQACAQSSYDTAVALTADAVKETKTVTVGANASHFSAGDFALIDQEDDAEVKKGDCLYFRRATTRSIEDRVEIASVNAGAGTITLRDPLHWTFKSAAPYSASISRVKATIVKWAGVESVALQGGTRGDYLGQSAGGIDMANAAYCWVKDVQTDGTIDGMHVSMSGAYRSVVRDGWFHNSKTYGFAEDCYGIVLRCGSAENLVENNIVRYMNKPILFDVTGSGNVVGYNYADNSFATPPAWQEVNIDEHCAFPHMELVEGNYAPHMGLTITHGNAGYFTYFRNYSSSQFAAPAVAGQNMGFKQTDNLTALQLDTGDINVTVIGNVFGSSAMNDIGTGSLSASYVTTDSSKPGIFNFGPGGKSDVSYTTLRAHGNYDTVTPGVVWDSKIATHTLPASLYLAARPAWWPAGTRWPWAGADLNPRVGTLPAKARSDSLGL